MKEIGVSFGNWSARDDLALQPICDALHDIAKPFPVVRHATPPVVRDATPAPVPH